MKKIYLLLITFFIINTAHSQGYVTIPDTNFVNWLQQNIPSAMNGNQMDTTSPAVTTLTVMNIVLQHVVDLNGIQYFKALTKLDCHMNYITSLTFLADSLQYLDCSYNRIPSLPVLPSTLRYLNCSVDTLLSIPALPASLKYLSCFKNHITSLPVLPSTLRTLICYENLLTNLPVLPDTLQKLDCNTNQITSIPVFPDSLRTIDCHYNQLTIIPVLPDSLRILYCSFNHLTSIPALPDSLKNLWCGYNKITTLPVLPPFLKSLEFNHALITVIPVLPAYLKELYCDSNQLSVLPVLPDSLKTLSCSINHLTFLPTLPPALHTLNCDNNQLTYLPALPATLHNLNCYINSITCFPPFPDYCRIYDYSIEQNPFTCLPNYNPSMGATSLAYPLCNINDVVNNPYGCSGMSGISGFIYNDTIANCSFDSVEYKTRNVHLLLYDSINNLISQTYTFANGAYNFQAPTGTYTVKIDTTGGTFYVACGNPGIDSTVVLTTANPAVYDVNFPITCTSGFNVGVQSVAYLGLVFPGQSFLLWDNAGDLSQWNDLKCSAGVSGQIQVTVTGPVTYQGVYPGALIPTVNGNVFTYNIPDFSAITNSTALFLIFTTDSTADSTNSVCTSVVVTPVIGDSHPSNNTFVYCENVMNSLDPNLKEVYPVNVAPGYSDYFTYTIHFQNTGTASAINISLLDTLNSNLDLRTFQVINYSHANTVTLNGNVLTVRFNNILLPDSTTNLQGSMGFLQYRIKPKTNLPEGTQIPNTAWIYFDYNAPIATNTTINHFDITGVNEASIPNTSIKIYPNPATTTLTIEGITTKATAEVYDISGKLLLSKQLNSNNIDISLLAKGMYFIKLSMANGVVVRKFVKE